MTRRAQPGAVYRAFAQDDALLYVGSSQDFGKRWQSHARKAPWWREKRHMTVTWYASLSQARKAERIAIAAERPRYNVAGLPVDLLHARELTRMLVAGTVLQDEGMTAALQELARALEDYLAGGIPESACVPARAISPEMVLDNLERPVDPRQERMREVVRHAPVTGIQAAGILTRLQVEGMDPARGTLHRWLAADEQAGLVRRGQYDANWRWTGASS